MIIRYAKSINLRINLDPVNEEMIYTPVLIITYRERTMDNIRINSLATVSFRSEYQMESGNATNAIQGIFIGTMILFGLIVII